MSRFRNYARFRNSIRGHVGAYRPQPPVIDPVDLPYIFETNTLNGYSLVFTTTTGAGFVRVGGLKSGAASNLTATLDGVAWPPVAIIEEPNSGGAVAAIFAAKDQSIGPHVVLFSGAVSKAAGRFGDVLTYNSIRQTQGDIVPSNYYYENYITGVLNTSDITMIAASTNVAASPISGDGIGQGQSFVTPLSVWFSHDPPPNSAADYYVCYPKANAPGVMLSVEVDNLKPIYPDLEKITVVQNASFTKLANGNYRIRAYYDSSVRFIWPLGQLLGGHEYDMSFTVVSVNGDACADWCDGTDSMADTVPAGNVTLTVGATTFKVKRTSYDSTFRFLDISNAEDDESGNWTEIEITPPVIKAA